MTSPRDPTPDPPSYEETRSNLVGNAPFAQEQPQPIRLTAPTAQTISRIAAPLLISAILFSNLRMDLGQFFPAPAVSPKYHNHTGPANVISDASNITYTAPSKNHTRSNKSYPSNISYSAPSKIHNDDDDAAYLEWLQAERNRSLDLSVDEEPIQIMYRAMNGLGHQLVRLSSAYHFAMLYQIPRIWPTHNPVCRGDEGIFEIYNYLIGEGQLMVDIPFFGDKNLFRNPKLFLRPNITLDHQGEKRVINFVNDVPGYSRAKSKLWIESKPIWSINYLRQSTALRKEESDYQLYQQLMLLFEHKHSARIQQVMEATRFNAHTVFGLHIRAGNGEGGDFVFKGRGMDDLDGWLKRVVSLLCDYKDKHSHYFTKKPLMVYVGTDTGSVIPKLQEQSNATCQIPFVSSDQTFVEEGGSVTWNHKYDDTSKCLKGWEDMWLDMYLFTRCNSVLAGTYSSFTQSAPLSFMMHKAKQPSRRHKVDTEEPFHPHYFCDVGANGDRMDCAATLVRWLNQTSHMTWGVLNGTKQKMRHEINFPIKERHGEIINALRKARIEMVY